jgi:DNA-binding SARP family transcriptional activator
LPHAGRLKQVASELRTRLSPALPGEALRCRNGAYQLLLQPGQVDLLRFRAGVASARGASGPDRARLTREALAEWGPGATGLYVGNPLSELPGRWADSTRARLRYEHRDAVMQCIEQGMSDGQYEMVMRECDQLAIDSDALGDDEFIEKRMLATYWSGHRTRAEQIFRQAADFMRSSLKLEPSGRLLRLAELIRDEDPRLGGPDGLPEMATVAVPAALNASAVTPVLAHSVPYLVSHERTAMSEPSITINIAGAARVGNVTGRHEGNLTIHMGGVTEPSGDPGDDGEPDGADHGEGH